MLRARYEADFSAPTRWIRRAPRYPAARFVSDDHSMMQRALPQCCGFCYLSTTACNAYRMRAVTSGRRDVADQSLPVFIATIWFATATCATVHGAAAAGIIWSAAVTIDHR